MKASDIMTKEVLMIHSWATVAEAIALMQNKKLHSLIVEPDDEEDAYGIVTETDIFDGVTAQQKDPETVKIEEIMTKPCIVVNPDLSLINVAQLFGHTGIKKAPVIKDKLLGIISITDILMKMKVAQLSPSDIVSQKIGDAILHSRVYRDPEDQIAQESEIAWDVVEELESQKAEARRIGLEG